MPRRQQQPYYNSHTHPSPFPHSSNPQTSNQINIPAFRERQRKDRLRYPTTTLNENFNSSPTYPHNDANSKYARGYKTSAGEGLLDFGDDEEEEEEGEVEYMNGGDEEEEDEDDVPLSEILLRRRRRGRGDVGRKKDV